MVMVILCLFWLLLGVGLSAAVLLAYRRWESYISRVRQSAIAAHVREETSAVERLSRVALKAFEPALRELEHFQGFCRAYPQWPKVAAA